jgi:hypothetical protein
MSKPLKDLLKVLLLVIAGLFVVSLVLGPFMPKPKPETADEKAARVEKAATEEKAIEAEKLAKKVAGSENKAIRACRDLVRPMLKLPNTAKFAGITESQATLSQGRIFQVRSFVESQNNFGGTVRIQYRCEVSTDDGEHFARVSLATLDAGGQWKEW